MEQTKAEPTEKDIAHDALRTAAVDVNHLRNKHTATIDPLVRLRLEARKLTDQAKGQSADKSTLAEIRTTRDKLLKVSTKLRKMADAEAELIEQHGAACEVLKAKWLAFDAMDSSSGLRLGINAGLKAKGVSLKPLPGIAGDAAGEAESVISELAAVGI